MAEPRVRQGCERGPASYVAWAADDMQEEITVEPSATVESFVKKVRDEFFFAVEGLAWGRVDLLSAGLAQERLEDLVPRGSRVVVNGGSGAVQGPPCAEGGAEVQSASREPDGAGRFSRGDAVRVINLKGRPELNGRLGRVERWVPGRQRWEVRLDSMQASDPPLGLAPDKLEQVAATPLAFKAGFLSGGGGALRDRRSAPRGVLVVLCGGGETGPGFRAKLSEVPLEGGTFEEQLAAAGIRCVFPFPKGAGVTDWFDPATMASPQIPEDLVGIAHSMEQVDGEIDRLTTEEGYAAHRIGLLGHGSGGRLALHLAYGAGRHRGELGAVASSGGFLPQGSVCFSAAASAWRHGSARGPSPPLLLSHDEDDGRVSKAWMEMVRCQLGAAGVRAPAEVLGCAGAGRGVGASELRALLEFFLLHLAAA